VVSFGDSLTHGFVITDKNTFSLHPYTIQINKNIVKNNQTKNLYAFESGVDGETTVGMIQRIKYMLNIYQPDIVSILGGTNDLFFTQSDDIYSAYNISLRIQKLHEICLQQNNHTTTIAITIPINKHFKDLDKVYDVNNFIRNYSKSNQNRVFLLDIENIFNYSIQSNDIYWSPDFVHYSPLGYNHIGNKVYNVIARNILQLLPTFTPTSLPTFTPTSLPTLLPTSLPTLLPTSLPSSLPTSLPTFIPTFMPTFMPTFAPTSLPTFTPTSLPTFTPTSLPTFMPSSLSTFIPTIASTQEKCNNNNQNGIQYLLIVLIIIEIPLFFICKQIYIKLKNKPNAVDGNENNNTNISIGIIPSNTNDVDENYDNQNDEP
jgi:lysophospholipase L1-like esterase